ncbi:unnamed protein product [Rotaria socialis]|uniref:Uncharacterized protein n=2 Tax=Rotaria socialis TaxID=392032 RepID=A0A817XK98_9BILA|nr:unnamed protein product [Rotaria socialis]CAF4292062.1 unnamed protein product [Rotaria socialis]CAF4556357.1 unnamed protein product [Rotaria socialis]CAF4682050.1 unnamed protein product [Rotaria socialis]
MNKMSAYPEGSYVSLMSSFSPAPNSSTLLPLNQSTLQQASSIDISSLPLEAGRQSFLYFYLHGPSVLSSGTSGSSSASQNNVSGLITGIGIRFEPAINEDLIIIIPLMACTSQTPGVALLWTFYDGSIIIRISITSPPSMCSTNTGSEIDGCILANYYSYAIVNKRQISLPLLVEMNVACGDVCSSSSSLCSASCAMCNGEQVAGSDTPVSRRYDMDATSGVFRFAYNTYTIKDRILVWNDETLLFDTGCVGASGTVYISYSSISSIIRVDVEPNCACSGVNGCTGTIWWFKLYCLNYTTG